MNIIINFTFKMFILILSLGNVLSAPINNQKILDPWIPLLPERNYFQVDRTIVIINPTIPPDSIYR